MSRTINRVELLGRVGNEPEMRYTPSGTAVTQLRLATDRNRQNGETEADWHTVTVWDKLGEAVNQYVQKGQRLYVAGRLAQNTYEAKDGNTPLRHRDLRLRGGVPRRRQREWQHVQSRRRRVRRGR